MPLIQGGPGLEAGSGKVKSGPVLGVEHLMEEGGQSGVREAVKVAGIK